MKSQKRTFLILVVSLIIFLGVYLGIRVYNQKAEEKEKQETKNNKIVVTEIDPEDVTAFSYEYEENQLSFVKEDGKWVCENNTGFSLNQDAVETMLSTLKELTAEASIDVEEQKENDKEDYGLHNPTMSVFVTEKDKTIAFTFGMHNSLTDQDYLKIDSDDTVYLVTANVKAAFQKSLTDLKENEDNTESIESTESK